MPKIFSVVLKSCPALNRQQTSSLLVVRLYKYKILIFSGSFECLLYEFFRAGIISSHVFKQHKVMQKESWAGKADVINICDILRRFGNTIPLLGGICTFLKQAQIYFSDVSVLLSVISGPPPDRVKLRVIH